MHMHGKLLQTSHIMERVMVHGKKQLSQEIERLIAIVIYFGLVKVNTTYRYWSVKTLSTMDYGQGKLCHVNGSKLRTDGCSSCG